MPELTEPLPGDEVDATWGEQVSNRVVSRYASEVQRDAGGPFEAGTPAFILDIDEFQVYDGAAWITYQSEALPTAGGTMTGDINMGGGRITNALSVATDQIRNAAGVAWINLTTDKRATLDTATPELALQTGESIAGDFWSSTSGRMHALNRAFWFCTMGNNAGWLAWNWARVIGGYEAGTSGGNDSATSVEMGNGYFRVGVEDPYVADSSPTVRFTVTPAGPTMIFETGAVLAAMTADEQDLAADFGHLVPAVAAGATDIDVDEYIEVPVREVISALLKRVKDLESP